MNVNCMCELTPIATRKFRIILKDRPSSFLLKEGSKEGSKFSKCFAIGIVRPNDLCFSRRLQPKAGQPTAEIRPSADASLHKSGLHLI